MPFLRSIPRRSKKKAAADREWKATVKARKERLGDVCEVQLDGICQGNYMVKGHHRKARRFGDHTDSNCLLVCPACHAQIHIYPEWSVSMGFIVKGNSL